MKIRKKNKNLKDLLSEKKRRYSYLIIYIMADKIGKKKVNGYDHMRMEVGRFPNV